MTVCVFVGPTLRTREVLEVCDAVCLPPAAQGDVYRAVHRKPHAIGIIDGYFSGAPSVWHKEILLALAEGIHVFGSASMGALRAAELHRFGMRGVGRIFEWFRDGILEDDDEVAIAHGPQEMEFMPVSEPMVNIRATLTRAATNSVISQETSSRIERIAKSLYFCDRVWPVILERAAADVPHGEVMALAEWLSQGKLDLKRKDAIEMLHDIRRTISEGKKFQPNFEFESTRLWQSFVERAAEEDVRCEPSEAERRRVLDELRLEGPEVYVGIMVRALLRRFVETQREPAGANAFRARVRAVTNEFRIARGLTTATALLNWCRDNDISEDLFDRLMVDETNLEAALSVITNEVEPYLLDELRLSGDYPRLAKRARAKQATLARAGDVMVGAAPNDVDAVIRRVWYFQSRLGRPPPDDMDAWIRKLGFDNLAEFDIVVAREWQFGYMNKEALS